LDGNGQHSPSDHPLTVTEVGDDIYDEDRMRCGDSTSTAADGAPPSYSSFSIWSILQATTRSRSSPGYDKSQQVRRSRAAFYAAGDDYAAWNNTGTRQLLMQAVITQPLGFQVERLSTPPCVTGTASV